VSRKYDRSGTYDAYYCTALVDCVYDIYVHTHCESALDVAESIREENHLSAHDISFYPCLLNIKKR